jgi:hypothetical protein
MARLNGLEAKEASWFVRLVYWLVKRKMTKLTGRAHLPGPVMITAHHPRLLRALGQMEMGQEAARTVPDSLKALASIKAATLIGCPF